MRQPIHIALIRQRYTAFGGAERFVARAMGALREQGAELTVVTRRWDDQSGTPALVCNPFYLGSLWRDMGFARCVCARVQPQAFDLVQSHERIACCDIYRAGDGVHREWLRQRSRTLGALKRLAIAVNPYHRYTLAAERALFTSPRLKAVICNSRMVRDEIMQHFGLPQTKLHVIYSGVDTDQFHPGLRHAHRDGVRARYGIPPDAPLFLFVGSGFERKGVPALLSAMQAIPGEAHLLIVGRDKKLAAFQRKGQNIAAGRVHFTGPQPDPKPFYGAADAFVLPTLYDPFPNVALEAMAAGLPVVTSYKSGAAELIRDGENGFVCDALDHERLATSMRRLCARATARQMGEAARHTVEPLTLDAMGEKLLNLYEELLAASRRPCVPMHAA
ncbi:MAG: glycosyltransferase family 4 protein [Betaproteobacteria bacterium]|nr:glycosyltransferase family 4 protein [Betaproteobacteria bacterium]